MKKTLQTLQTLRSKLSNTINSSSRWIVRALARVLLHVLLWRFVGTGNTSRKSRELQDRANFLL